MQRRVHGILEALVVQSPQFGVSPPTGWNRCASSHVFPSFFSRSCVLCDSLVLLFTVNMGLVCFSVCWFRFFLWIRFRPAPPPTEGKVFPKQMQKYNGQRVGARDTDTSAQSQSSPSRTASVDGTPRNGTPRAQGPRLVPKLSRDRWQPAGAFRPLVWNCIQGRQSVCARAYGSGTGLLWLTRALSSIHTPEASNTL